MTLKTPKKFLAMKGLFVDLNRTFARVFQAKVESIYKREASGVGSFGYQSMEHGEVNFSANGSPTVAQTFSLQEKQNKIVYAIAHALSTQISAHVTDITQTAITIECRAISGTANFSDVTTSVVRVFYKVQGSNP